MIMSTCFLRPKNRQPQTGLARTYGESSRAVRGWDQRPLRRTDCRKNGASCGLLRSLLLGEFQGIEAEDVALDLAELIAQTGGRVVRHEDDALGPRDLGEDLVRVRQHLVPARPARSLTVLDNEQPVGRHAAEVRQGQLHPVGREMERIRRSFTFSGQTAAGWGSTRRPAATFRFCPTFGPLEQSRPRRPSRRRYAGIGQGASVLERRSQE